MDKPIKVLLLQTSEEYSQLLLEALRAGEYRLESHRVDSLTASLKALEQAEWDLILSEYFLADGSVMGLLDALGKSQRDIPLIITCLRADVSLVVECMHAGARDFMLKDDLERLLPAVERELREHDVRLENRKMAAKLKESEERFRELTENIHEVFWLMDCQTGRFIYLSPSFIDTWDRPPEAVLEEPRKLLDYIHPEDFSRIAQIIDEQGWLGFNDDFRIQLTDGQDRWLSTRSFPILDAQGELYRIAGLTRDISTYKELSETSQNLTRALEQTADGVMIAEHNGTIVYVNTAFEDMTGYSRFELLGNKPSILKSGLQDSRFYDELWRNLTSGLPFTDIFINRRKDGELYFEEQTVTPVRDTNRDITHFVSTGKDITARLRAQERLHKIVHYDAVTGLATRLLLIDRLEQSIKHARRLESKVGVMCIGLDFRTLLDGVHDRRLEEQVLRTIAHRLRESVHEHITLAHSGNDEFVLVHRHYLDPLEIEVIAGQIIEAFAVAIEVDGYQLYLSPAIGISLFPEHGDDTAQLLRSAKQAMLKARQAGSGHYRFHSPGGEKGEKQIRA